MKRAFAVLAVVTSCLPSTSDYARGPIADAGAPETSTPIVEAGVPEAGPVEAGVDAGTLPKSCKEAKAAQPAATDGFVTTTHGDVYCNMSLDGGGWTMAGRSHDEEDGADQLVPFGWHSVTGDVHDPNHPYSLGVIDFDFDFTQVLIAKVNDPGTMDLGQTYELSLTKTELLAVPTTTFEVDAITTLKGSCRPAGGPSMLFHAGYTSTTNQFHFRDVADGTDKPNQQFGLIWYGFETNFTDCNQGGNLESQGGAVFVR